MLSGGRFKELREKHGYTHEELAELLGIGTTQIWRYENEKTDPSTKILGRIAKVFGVSTDYLLGLSDDPISGMRIDNLSQREKMVLAAMRRGEVVEAIRLMATSNGE